MQGLNFFRNLETVVRELDARTHEVVVLYGIRLDDAAAGIGDAKSIAKQARKRVKNKEKFAIMERSIKAVRMELPGIVFGYRPEPDERWQRRLREGRKVINRARSTFARITHRPTASPRGSTGCSRRRRRSG